MNSIIQKGIIARTQFQDKKFSNQSTMSNTKVRSGHNSAVFLLSFQAVMLFTKAAINQCQCQ